MCFFTACKGLNFIRSFNSGKINPLKAKLRPNWTEPCFTLPKLGDFHELESSKPGGRSARPYQTLLNLLGIGTRFILAGTEQAIVQILALESHNLFISR
jgi:hypothetical protein